jgi:hypothetical protein
MCASVANTDRLRTRQNFLWIDEYIAGARLRVIHFVSVEPPTKLSRGGPNEQRIVCAYNQHQHICGRFRAFVATLVCAFVKRSPPDQRFIGTYRPHEQTRRKHEHHQRAMVRPEDTKALLYLNLARTTASLLAIARLDLHPGIVPTSPFASWNRKHRKHRISMNYQLNSK